MTTQKTLQLDTESRVTLRSSQTSPPPECCQAQPSARVHLPLSPRGSRALTPSQACFFPFLWPYFHGSIFFFLLQWLTDGSVHIVQENSQLLSTGTHLFRYLEMHFPKSEIFGLENQMAKLAVAIEPMFIVSYAHKVKLGFLQPSWQGPVSIRTCPMENVTYNTLLRNHNHFCRKSFKSIVEQKLFFPP